MWYVSKIIITIALNLALWHIRTFFTLDLNRWCWQFDYCGEKSNERLTSPNWLITHLDHLLLVLHCLSCCIVALNKKTNKCICHTWQIIHCCWSAEDLFITVWQCYLIISSILSLSPWLSHLLSSPFLPFVYSTLSPNLSPSMAAWDLSVIVEDLGNEAPPVTLSVTSDFHIGGVMLKLVEKTRRLLSVCIC